MNPPIDAPSSTPVVDASPRPLASSPPSPPPTPRARAAMCHTSSTHESIHQYTHRRDPRRRRRRRLRSPPPPPRSSAASACEPSRARVGSSLPLPLAPSRIFRLDGKYLSRFGPPPNLRATTTRDDATTTRDDDDERRETTTTTIIVPSVRPSVLHPSSSSFVAPTRASHPRRRPQPPGRVASIHPSS